MQRTYSFPQGLIKYNENYIWEETSTITQDITVFVYEHHTAPKTTNDFLTQVNYSVVPYHGPPHVSPLLRYK